MIQTLLNHANEEVYYETMYKVISFLICQKRFIYYMNNM